LKLIVLDIFGLFDVLILKINFKKIKLFLYIFKQKNTIKNNHYYNIKHYITFHLCLSCSAVKYSHLSSSTHIQLNLTLGKGFFHSLGVFLKTIIIKIYNFHKIPT